MALLMLQLHVSTWAQSVGRDTPPDKDQGNSTFFVPHMLSHLDISYRRAMEFQVTLHYRPSLRYLGGITRKLDFKVDLNDYNVVIIRNLVGQHVKALSMETE